MRMMQRWCGKKTLRQSDNRAARVTSYSKTDLVSHYMHTFFLSMIEYKSNMDTLRIRQSIILGALSQSKSSSRTQQENPTLKKTTRQNVSLSTVCLNKQNNKQISKVSWWCDLLPAHHEGSSTHLIYSQLKCDLQHIYWDQFYMIFLLGSLSGFSDQEKDPAHTVNPHKASH